MPDFVVCETCGTETTSVGTRRCDTCYEVETRLKNYALYGGVFAVRNFLGALGLAPLRRILNAIPPQDLSDTLSDLTPLEWRRLIEAAGEHRCIKCGEFDECVCPETEE